MTNQAIQNAKLSSYERSQGMQDVLLVSSFGLWATLLGFMPVMAFRILMGS
jgi:hypothetical protein